MSKTATVRARLEPDLKDKAEEILRRIGLNASQAITMFYRQIELNNGMPFSIAIPTETTRTTMEKTDSGKDLILCEDADDMFDKLGI